MDLTIGATLTGGTTQTWTKQSTSGSKASFVSPTHTRLEPRLLEVGVAGGEVLNAVPGIARSTFKVSFASRNTDEGCCSATPGNVIFDGALRWNLNQPETLAEDVIDVVRAFVYSDEFSAMVKNGMLPNT